MKICFVTSSFPRYREDTAAPWLLRTAEELTKKGSEISIFVPSFKRLKQTSYESIRIYRFGYFLSFFETLTHEESSAAKLHRIGCKILVIFYVLSGCINSFFYFLRNKFNVIDVHWPFPQAIFGIIGKYLTGAKLVYHFYASEILLIKKDRFIKILVNFFMLFADHIITISSFTESLIKNELKYKIPVDVIPFGANTYNAISSEVTHINKSKIDKIRLLFVGRLIERKGIIYLLEAVKTLNEWGIPVLLTIVGEGYEKVLVKNFVEKYKLEKHINIKGEVPLQELKEAYNKCDIFVFPSIIDSRGDTEGLGVVLIEALMFKRPVIASAVGGIVDIIKDNVTGFLVPEKDSKALAEKILFIKDNYDYAKKIAENGFDYVNKNFSWDVIIPKFLKVYRN